MSNSQTQNAVQGLVSTIARVVSGLSPVAKAVVAAVVPTIAAVVNLAFAGGFNTTSIVVLVTGLIGSLGVYLAPNTAAK